MTTGSRSELLESLRPAYSAGSLKQKGEILDSIVAATGYNRKYATQLLIGYQSAPAGKRQRKKMYDDHIHEPLKTLWLAANRVCSKRLVSAIPTLLPILEQRKYLKLSTKQRASLLSMSAATVDRILREDRKEYGPRKRQMSFSNALRQQIPIRTKWENPAPGFCEIDLVTHGGQSASGHFLHTLTLTDIATGWTENQVLLRRTDDFALSAIKAAIREFPVSLLGLDCDNGGEFINHLLDKHCKNEGIELTRCREYRKNDQAHVEQKNGAIVRRLVGYDRFEGKKSLAIMKTLYSVSRLYNNYFQPSFKLLSKVRVGSKVGKTYDVPKTPYQRILDDISVSEKKKDRLRSVFRSLDPVQLLELMRSLQDKLWKTALVDQDAHVHSIAKPTLSRPKKPQKSAPRKPLPHRRRGKKRNTQFDERIWSEQEKNPALSLPSAMKIFEKRFGELAPTRQTVSRRMNEWRDKHPEYSHLYFRNNKRSTGSKSLVTG